MHSAVGGGQGQKQSEDLRSENQNIMIRKGTYLFYHVGIPLKIKSFYYHSSIFFSDHARIWLGKSNIIQYKYTINTMASETTSLLSDKDGSDRRRSTYLSSRFGTPSEGVRPNRKSINSIPLELQQWHNRSLSNQADTASSMLTRRHSATAKHRVSRSAGTLTGMEGGLTKRGSRASFIEHIDGTVSTLTPIEMGRQELYEDIPFLAVSGLQRKEHNLSVAFSSYAAALDTLEEDEFIHSTTGKRMTSEEKEKRMSQMSLLLLDELEADAVTVTTPLIFAVLIASMLQFIYGYNIGVMNPPEPYVFPGHSTGKWSMAVAAFCIGGPAGSVLGGQWADSRGRRGALLIITWLFVFGGLMQACAPTLDVVIIARAIIGLASGASSVLVPLYLGEMAPPNLRGVIGTMVSREDHLTKMSSL